VIRVGTAGFSYSDWREHFYPPATRPSDFLAFYADQFDAVELNFSYYRVPDARTLARMLEKSRGRVEFTLKAYRAMTHSRDAPEETVTAFVDALAPLRDAGRLGALLLQFPFSFQREIASEAYLASLAESLRRLWPEIPLVAEFRHRSWVSEDAFGWLRAHRLGFCAVDEPQIGNLMPPVAVNTGSIAYVRFHGRNARKWWKHDRPEERYDYLYADEELLEWIPKIRALEAHAEKTFVFFNNHFQAKAVDNARRLLQLLGAEAPPEGERRG
jgi:uncharacterized protein YecE (DUF72 family)